MVERQRRRPAQHPDPQRRSDGQVQGARWTSRAGGTSRRTTTSSTPRSPTDGGESWKPIDGTADGKPIPRDGSDQPGLTGVSKTYHDLSFPLDDFAGKKIDLRFRYLTDGGVAQKGFAADSLSITADGEAVVRGRRRGRGRQRLGHEGVLAHRRVLHQAVPAVLHRREPQPRLVRQVAEVRPVQLRLDLHEARLGRALRVPEGAAALAVGHLSAGQQRLGAPR